MKESVVLIPSYEPDDLLINTIESLINEGFSVLLVNDGSSSEYDSIFDKVKDKVVYFSYKRNRGKGYAMKYGYKKLLTSFPDAKFVITADGDGQHATSDIIRVHEELVKYNQLVFGVRHFGDDVPFRSRFGNSFSKVTRSLLTKSFIPDDQCGLRGFPIRYLNELINIKGSRYEYEMNQLIRFQLKQYPIITLPIQTIYLDSNSRSHFSPFKDTFRIQSIIFSHSIVSIIFVALCITLSLLSCYYFEPTTYSSWLTLIYLGCFTFSFFINFLIYPSKRFGMRLLKSMLFAGIEYFYAIRCILIILSIKPDIYGFVVPFFIFTSYFFNIFFAWVFRDLFPSYRHKKK